jgi:DNA adenine methylase
MRPLLRWAGSKLSVLNYLKDSVAENFTLYVEPFCGSAALYFYLEPNRAVLSDINENLINFYREFRDRFSYVQGYADALPRTKEAYYQVRNSFKECQSPEQRAIMFFYLNRNCFNGLYRTDRAGMFNVPYAGQKTGKLPASRHCLAATKLLRGATLEVADFERVIVREAKPGVFFFLDPPYAVAYRRPFTDYAADGFLSSDIKRMQGCLEAIDDSGASFAMTYDSALADKFLLRRNWRQQRIEVRRNISGFAANRRYAAETITTNG